MDSTRQMIEQILTEIETKQEIGTSGKKSVNEVMETILGRKIDAPVAMIAPAQQNTSSNTAGMDLEELRFWKEKNNQIYTVNTDHSLYSSHGSIIGKIEIFIKKVVRKLIRPIIFSIVAEQNEFNASVTASINALYNNDITANSFILESADLKNRINANQEQMLNQLEQTQKDLKEEIKALKDELNAVKETKSSSIYSLIDYDKFEGYFRGNKEQIKEAQRIYLPYYKEHTVVADLGCGRGEFLELLKEVNVNAIGVEPYHEFVEECQNRNLKVVEQDAISYLNSIETESLDGIFAAQLIEHLTPLDLVRLCRVSYDKMKFGGCLIFETPNPTCLSVYTNAFYVDPTHEKPVHPKTIEYYLKDAGFTSVEIIYPENSRVDYKLPLLNIAGADNLAEVNDGINLMTDLIFGSQNYAVVAHK